MRFKPGVGIRKLSPQVVLAMAIAERVFLNHAGLGYEPTVTSVADSKHGARSKHYEGGAFDLRTKDLLREDAAEIFVELKKRLDGIGFDVIWEDRTGPNQHFHVEYDPKPGEA